MKPLPFVREVIFLATPQRGSYLAGPQLVRRLAAYFVRLPSDVLRVGADLATSAPTGATGLPLNRIPTSIDNMSPGNPLHPGARRDPREPAGDRPLDHRGRGRRSRSIALATAW